MCKAKIVSCGYRRGVFIVHQIRAAKVLKMAMKINCVFTLIFIMGLQMQYPVTMFPASSESGGATYIAEEVPTVISADGGVISPDTMTGMHQGKLAALNTANKDAARGEHSQMNIQYRKHVAVNDAIQTAPLESSSFNQTPNQAHRGDLRDFNGGQQRLSGLNQDLIQTAIDSPNSVINRIRGDLTRFKLEHIQNQLANISANLKSHKNSLTNNNGETMVKESKLDKDRLDPARIQSGHIPTTHITDIDSAIVNKTTKYVQGIRWSADVVSKCPSHFSGDQDKHWRTTVNTMDVVRIEAGCGSMQNRLITFNDSSKACVRYRLNADQMQGEIYSYYLGKLLNMSYTPPTTMHTVDSSRQWHIVRNDVITSKWSDNKPIIVTKWLNSLEPVFMPEKLKEINRKLQEENYQFNVMPMGEMCDLVQWSDLIVFDYISANLDRVVNNMFNLKWNPNMLDKPIHNLERIQQDGQYVFIDNESGLFHGYRLLDTYDTYHEKLLESVCIFRPSTVDTLEKLYVSGDAGDKLQQLYESNEHLHTLLPRMANKNKQILQSRIQRVVKRMQMCKHDSGIQ